MAGDKYALKETNISCNWFLLLFKGECCLKKDKYFMQQLLIIVLHSSKILLLIPSN